MNNLLSTIIVKILIFLRFFPGSRFLNNFQLLLSSFLINLKMAESFVHRPITLKSQQRPKSVFKKLNYTYLILTYILLTSTIREVRSNSKENFSIDIGLQGCFPITIPAYCALHALPAVASWLLIARRLPWLTKFKLMFLLDGRSSQVLRSRSIHPTHINYNS